MIVKYIKPFLVLCFLILCSQSDAQMYSFSKKKSYISIGYTFPYMYNANMKSWDRLFNSLEGGSTTKSYINPIFVNYELGLNSHFGVGLSLSYQQYKYNFVQNNVNQFAYENQSMMAMARGNYHPWVLKRWDPYLGAGLGYSFEFKDKYADPHNYKGRFAPPLTPRWVYNVYIGVKNYWKSLGWFAEVGYSNSHLVQLGLVYRFGPDLNDTEVFW